MTGHSFLSSILEAMAIDDAGLDSAPTSPALSPTTLPSSPLTPIASDGSSHSMDVPRCSSAITPSSPLDDHVILPEAPPESDWSGASSDCSTDGESNCGDPLTDTESTSQPAPSNNKKRQRKSTPGDNAARKVRRKTKSQQEAQLLGPTSVRPSTFSAVPSPLITKLPATSAPVTTTGFTGKRLGSLKPKQLWRLSELKALGMGIVPWDGWYVPPLYRT